MMRLMISMAMLPLLAAAAPPTDHGEPYRILQHANLALDPALAASAYAADARLILDYSGSRPEIFRGRDAIRAFR